MAETYTSEVLKVYARRLIQAAIGSGRMSRPDRCGGCGRICRPQAHHVDYSRPLEVEWLCPTCHKQRHGPTSLGDSRLRLRRTVPQGERRFIQRFFAIRHLDIWLAAERFAHEHDVSLYSVLADALARYLAQPPPE